METRIAFSVNIFTEIEYISGILRPYIYANQSKKSKKNIFLLLFDIALPRTPQDKEQHVCPPKKRNGKIKILYSGLLKEISHYFPKGAQNF